MYIYTVCPDVIVTFNVIAELEWSNYQIQSKSKCFEQVPDKTGLHLLHMQGKYIRVLEGLAEAG